MSRVMDIQCNVEFPSDAMYLAHKKSGHTLHLDKATPLDAPPIPTPPPGVGEPTPEFIEAVKRIEEKQDPVKKPSTHPNELPPTQPIKLKYLYEGECPEHRRPVSTLEIDVAEKHFCIAFCTTTNHQVEAQEVKKL